MNMSRGGVCSHGCGEVAGVVGAAPEQVQILYSFFFLFHFPTEVCACHSSLKIYKRDQLQNFNKLCRMFFLFGSRT